MRTNVRVTVGYLLERGCQYFIHALLAFRRMVVHLRQYLDEHNAEEVAGAKRALHYSVPGLSESDIP